MTARLLIIEDDPEIISALQRGLGLHGYETEAANQASDGLAKLVAGDFVGAVIDVMLGADSGLDVVRAARAQGVRTPIVMLSALSDVEHRAAGLEAGADDYLVKPFAFDELVARLRVQEARAQAKHPAPATLEAKSRTLSTEDTEIVLTEREYALLDLLVQNAGQPLTRGAIFDKLWSVEGSGNENVVDVYIGYLRKKLATGKFGFEIKTLRNKGFCLQGITPHAAKTGAATKV